MQAQLVGLLNYCIPVMHEMLGRQATIPISKPKDSQLEWWPSEMNARKELCSRKRRMLPQITIKQVLTWREIQRYKLTTVPKHVDFCNGKSSVFSVVCKLGHSKWKATSKLIYP